MQSCKHTHVHVCEKLNSVLRLLVPEEIVRHSLHNPPFVNYATQQSNTYSFKGGRRDFIVEGQGCLRVISTMTKVGVWCKKVGGQGPLAPPVLPPMSLVPKGRMNILGSAGWRRRMVANLGFPHAVWRQERALWLLNRCTAVLICKWWPAVQYIKLIVSVFWLERRERQSKWTLRNFIGHFTIWHTILYGVQESMACGQ